MWPAGTTAGGEPRTGEPDDASAHGGRERGDRRAGKSTDGQPGPSAGNGRLHHAQYGSQNETMDVRFPISGNDGFENYPEISDFQASVNGSAVNTHRTTGKDPFGTTTACRGRPSR